MKSDRIFSFGLVESFHTKHAKKTTVLHQNVSEEQFPLEMWLDS